jgi:hypothetical protein
MKKKEREKVKKSKSTSCFITLVCYSIGLMMPPRLSRFRLFISVFHWFFSVSA